MRTIAQSALVAAVALSLCLPAEANNPPQGGGGAGGVPTSTTITTTAPLTGGGDLSASRVIAVAAVSSNEVLIGQLNGLSGTPGFRPLDSVDLGGVSWTGDTRGHGTAQTVWAIQGRNVTSSAPTDQQVLTWDAATSTIKWAPSGGSGSQNLDQVLATGNTTTRNMQLNGANTTISGPLAPDTGAGSTNTITFTLNGGNGASFQLGGAASGAFMTGPTGTTVDPAPTVVAGGSGYSGHYGAAVQIFGGADQTNNLDSASGDVQILTGGLSENGLEISRYGDVAPSNSSSLAQNATHGFWFVPRCASGAPSGTPTTMFPGAAAVVVGGDHHLYAELTSGTFSQVDGGGSTPGLSSVLGQSNATGAHYIASVQASTSTLSLEALVSGDSNARFGLYADGGHVWGDGTNIDLGEKRLTTSTLALTDGSTGSGSLVPLVDLSGTLGTASLRWASLNGKQVNASSTSASDVTIQSYVTGDSQGRFFMRADGGWALGPGSAAFDCGLDRAANGIIETNGGSPGTLGGKLKLLSTTGSGTSTLGANCPGGTTPAVWFELVDASGTTRYVPGF